MTADNSSVAFGSVNVGSSSSGQTITITHSHADKITASVSGANASDFILSTTTPISNSVSEDSEDITVTFKPTCNGSRSATLTLKSSYTGLADVTISLSGTGVRVVNTLAVAATSKSMKVDEEWTGVVTAKGEGDITGSSTNSSVATYDVANNKIVALGAGSATVTISQEADCKYNSATKTISVSVSKHDQTLSWSSIEENMLLGATQDITATASSGLAVSYSTSDASTVSVSGNRLTAAGIGSAIITASQTGNYKYNAATTITKTVNVFNKEVPEFTPSFAGSACALFVEGTATIALDNVSDGLAGDFRAVAADPTVVSVTRSGSTLTITGLKQGSTTVTLTQTENSEIFAAGSVVYTFNVSRVSNTLAVAATSRDMKVDEAWSAVATTNSNATLEASSTNSSVATYNATTNTITAHNEGTTDIIIRQAQNVKYTAAACTISVSVTKYDNTLAVATTSYSKKVDDTWSCAVSSINSDAAITVTTHTTTDSLTATYNTSTKAVDLNVKHAGSYTVNLIQPATYKYTATTKTITVVATKYSNAITVRMGGSVRTSQELYFGESSAVSFSSSNGLYAGEGDPFTIAQTAGDTLGSFVWDDESTTTGSVSVGAATGTATWKVRQEADYKYEAAEKTFSVTIVKIIESCNLLTDAAERSIAPDYISSEWQAGSAGRLYFQVKRQGLADKTITVYQKIDGGWENMGTCTAGSSYSSHSYDLDARATAIKINTSSNKVVVTYYSDIKNINITRRTYLTTSVTEDYLAFSPTISAQKTKTFTASYSTCDAGDLRVFSTNPKFTVSPTEVAVSDGTSGATGDITITCADDAIPTDSGYVVVCDKAKSCSIKVKVSRPEPVLTWNPYGNSYFVNNTIPNICVSENTDYENCPLSYSSSDNSISYVTGSGELVILDKKQPVIITVTQGESEDFLATSKSFTFTPMDMPDRGLPLVMTETVYNEAIRNEGAKSWQGSNGVRLGDPAPTIANGFNWDDRYIIFAFHGTPDKLTFKYKTTSGANTGCDWYVAESSNGTSWSQVWFDNYSSTDEKASGEIQLRPNTIFLKFCYSGNYGGFFKDIKVTELIGDYYLRNEESGEYLSRGETWSTLAITDEFGAPVRITRTTTDNINITTHFLFYDNRQYLYEEGSSHDIYTDNTTNNNWLFQKQSDDTYIVQSANGVGTNGQSLTVGSDHRLTLTTDGSAATKWSLEHADQHPAAMTALLDAQAESAASLSPDFGTGATRAMLDDAMSNFDMKPMSVPVVTIAQQSGRNNPAENANCEPYSYENTVSGLTPGLYRLTLEACYRPAAAAVAAENAAVAGHENILAYMFANGQKTQIKSVYNEGTPVPTSQSDAVTAFDAERFRNYIYLYVADEGAGTGSVHYGLHKPSWVDGEMLWYRSFILEQITRKEYILDGNGTDEQTAEWSTDENWLDSNKPGVENWAIVRHDAVINTPISVFGVRLENDAVLNISPTGGLTIGAGGVISATAGNLILRASAEGANKGQTGYLRISPAFTGAMPHASVELFSVGYYDAARGEDNSAAWQYVGAPVTPASAQTLEHTYYGSWVYRWDEQTGAWASTGNNGKMQPFAGYCTTQKKQPEGLYHSYGGQILSNKLDTTIALSYHTTAADGDYGFNLLANSFSAPIDLTQMRSTDFSGDVEHTVYLYNTGSKADWLAQQQAGTLFSQDSGTTAGQYVAVPVGNQATLAALISASGGAVPAVVPSMQGFRINATGEGATLRLSYNRLVWQANYTAYPNKPLRAPGYRIEQQGDTVAEQDTVVNAVALTLSADGYSDRLYLLESDIYTAQYDDGADARKLDGGMFNIFAFDSQSSAAGRPLAVCASDDLRGVTLGVRCDRQRHFTLTCTYATAEGLALRDILTGEKMPLVEGMTCELDYDAESTGAPRFIVEKYEQQQGTLDTDVTTALETAFGDAEQPVRVYDVTGKLLMTGCNAKEKSSLPAGVYLQQKGNVCKKIIRL